MCLQIEGIINNKTIVAKMMGKAVNFVFIIFKCTYHLHFYSKGTETATHLKINLKLIIITMSTVTFHISRINGCFEY